MHRGVGVGGEEGGARDTCQQKVWPRRRRAPPATRNRGAVHGAVHGAAPCPSARTARAMRRHTASAVQTRGSPETAKGGVSPAAVWTKMVTSPDSSTSPSTADAGTTAPFSPPPAASLEVAGAASGVKSTTPSATARALLRSSMVAVDSTVTLRGGLAIAVMTVWKRIVILGDSSRERESPICVQRNRKMCRIITTSIKVSRKTFRGICKP